MRFYYGNLYAWGLASPVYTCYNGHVFDADTGREVTSLNEEELYDKPYLESGKRTFTANGKLMIDTSTLEVYNVCITDADRDNFLWEYKDRGTFYDPEAGIGTDYYVQYEMESDGRIYMLDTKAYNYKPNPSGTGEYYSQASEMYDLEFVQQYYDSDMALTFHRYDGTDIKFDIRASKKHPPISTKKEPTAPYIAPRPIP